MTRKRVWVAAAGAAALLCTTSAFSKPLITQNVDENSRSTLAGNLRPEVSAANDRGRVSDATVLNHMELVLKRSPDQEQALVGFIDSLQTKGSPNYHHWLTAAQFGQQYGVASSDLKTISNWLGAHGFVVTGVEPGGMSIDFSGTAGQVRQAFRTEIHQFTVKGVAHIANNADPSIPAALSPVVAGVASLHDFRPRTMHKSKPAYSFTSGGSPYQALVPADLATIYNLTPLFQSGLTGVGQSVVVIEDTNLQSNADWSTFRSKFGLNAWGTGSLTTVHPAGSHFCVSPGVNSDDVEADLDVQWASAAAPRAAIVLASCANTSTTFGGLLALQNLVNSAQPPAIVSISYGECEAYNGASANAAYYNTYQQAAAEGVSVFVSSGDEGAASCDANQSSARHGIGVSGFASTPYNVAVGGTDYADSYFGTNDTYWNATNTTTYGSAKSYIPEIPWNDSCASVLISNYVSGSPVTYGNSGFCNSSSASYYGLLTTASGSGGPSGCATGTPSRSGVVSGTCRGWAKPSWQTGIAGIVADNVRDIPDVSLFAADGVWGHYYVFCYTDYQYGGTPCTGAPANWAGAGGTSFSSPIMAAIQALVNQKKGVRQGNPDSVYYALARTEYGTTGNPACNSSNGNAVSASCVFHDITLGDMDVNCNGPYNCYDPSGSNGVLSVQRFSYVPSYGSGSGWDFATGLGTVNAANLVNNWP